MEKERKKEREGLSERAKRIYCKRGGGGWGVRRRGRGVQPSLRLVALRRLELLRGRVLLTPKRHLQEPAKIKQRLAGSVIRVNDADLETTLTFSQQFPSSPPARINV